LVGRVKAYSKEKGIYSPPRAQYLIVHSRKDDSTMVLYNKEILQHLKDENRMNSYVTFEPDAELVETFYTNSVRVGLRVAEL
jgi:hypothetical protein